MIIENTGSIYRTLPFSITKADSFFKRFKGLMFRNKPIEQEGLWIVPCNSIHMFFMLFSIDVVFLDKNNQIVKLVEDLRPWRMITPVKNAHSTVELPVGTIKHVNLQTGQHLHL